MCYKSILEKRTEEEGEHGEYISEEGGIPGRGACLLARGIALACLYCNVILNSPPYLMATLFRVYRRRLLLLTTVPYLLFTVFGDGLKELALVVV